MSLKSFFNRSEKSTAAAALILMVSLLAANLLGLLKLRLFTHLFQGASGQLGIFLASDRLPNFIFNVLAVGALSSSFVPIFSQSLAAGQKERAFRLASTLFNLSLLVYLAIGVVFFTFTNEILYLVSWGRLGSQENILLNESSRILFLGQLFFLLSAFASGILQGFNRFISMALAPVVYNLAVIFFTFILSPRLGILAASWATVLGAFCHFLVQVPALAAVGFFYRPAVELKDKLFGEIGRIFVPRSLSLVVNQLGLLLFTSFSLALSASSVVIFNLAQRLELVPVVLFGSTFSQASFATLSRNAEMSSEEFLATFKKVFYYLSFLILPASIFLIVLRVPLVRIFFGSKNFDWSATLLTAHTLSLFAVGMFFQAQVGLLARSFFALKNSRLPLKSSLFSLLAGATSAVTFIYLFGFGVWSLGLAASVASVLDFLILYLALSQRFGELRTREFVKPVLKMTLASLISGLVAYSTLKFFDLRWPFFDTRYFINLVNLTALAILTGGLSYLWLCYKLGLNEGRRVVALLSKIRGFGPRFLSELFQE